MKRKFDIQDLAIEFVPEIASVFWPSFFEEHGLVYVEFTLSKRGPGESRSGAPDLWEQSEIERDIAQAFGDRTGAEASYSHTHIFDLFRRDENIWSEARSTYKRSHPHFKAAEKIGRVLAEMWFAKLCRDFPDNDFRVYYTRDSDPTVRFHRVYPGEPPWMDIENEESVQGFVLDSRQNR